MTGPPGCRKTLTLLDRIIATPGRHIISFPRNLLIDEQADYLRARALETNVVVSVEPIHSDQSHHRGEVGRRVEKAIGKHRSSSHSVILVSHVALLDLDPSLIADWHVAIDEIVDISVASGSIRLGASWHTLEKHYELVPTSQPSAWKVVPRAGVQALKRRQVTNDAAQSLAAFHTCANSLRRDVYVDVERWADAQNGRQVRWWSIWTPLCLQHCKSVTLTGAGFFQSIPYLASKWRHGDRIVFDKECLGGLRASPTVRVNYYTERHTGTTTWWKTDAGSHCLVQISRHLEAAGGVGIYMCNEMAIDHFRHRIQGLRCQPKQAGTNSLLEHTSCMAIYSNKGQDADAAILGLLGLDKEVIRQSREYEDIRQFIMRGAIRRPDFGGEYDIHVYDRAQAEDLDSYLRECGITCVTLVPVIEPGIMDVEIEGSGSGQRKPRLSVEERRARDRERKRVKRAEKQREGTARPRGRPKNVGMTPPAC